MPRPSVPAPPQPAAGDESRDTDAEPSKFAQALGNEGNITQEIADSVDTAVEELEGRGAPSDAAASPVPLGQEDVTGEMAPPQSAIQQSSSLGIDYDSIVDDEDDDHDDLEDYESSLADKTVRVSMEEIAEKEGIELKNLIDSGLTGSEEPSGLTAPDFDYQTTEPDTEIEKDLLETVLNDPTGATESKETESKIGFWRSRRVHIVALMGAVGVFIGVAALLNSSPESQDLVQTQEVQAHQSAEPTTEPEPEATQPEAPAEQPEKADQQIAAVDTATQLEAATPQIKCKPFADYPDFPWKETLLKIVAAAGTPGLCGLFKKTPREVGEMVAELSHFGPVGHDLIENAFLIEIFPKGEAKRGESTIELKFVDDALYAVRLMYETSLKDKGLKDDLFKKSLGRPIETGTDHLGRSFTRYVDGDLEVDLLHKTDRYKRDFYHLFIRHGAMKDELASRIKAANQAEAAYVKGVEQFQLHQYKEAMTQFAIARNQIPQMGSAYWMEGMILLRQEAFKKADEMAQIALERSRDRRARANMEGLRAVVAMFQKDFELAKKRYRSAEELDPTNKTFARSFKELETGEYEIEQVAKTAARMSCRKRKKWTVNGLFARGNFPDQKVFYKAVRTARSNKEYDMLLKRWTGWECR